MGRAGKAGTLVTQAERELGQQPGSGATGFQGSIASLPLVDLLQVWSMNQFSGLVAVTSLGRAGHLYFVHGEVVHAEAGHAEGEEAVHAILGWAGGSFEPHPNTTTLKRTIQKRMSHLLLDAHRHLDEQSRDSVAPRLPGPARESATTPAEPEGLDQLRAIGGVTGLVFVGTDGQPTGSAGPDAEELAGKGLYFGLIHAAAVAEVFGLHDLGVATLRSENESLVLVRSEGGSLCVALSPGVAVEPVAARARALLAKAPRSP